MKGVRKHSCATLDDILGRSLLRIASYWKVKPRRTPVLVELEQTQWQQSGQFSDVYSRDIGYTERKGRYGY